ncbi:MAG TPA: TonB-dependent receptor [Candidatus Sulfotelmatobacter sp.]|nr:TonB-dependent receptor [Candidatus Sulfotelmatobacter sp.]
MRPAFNCTVLAFTICVAGLGLATAQGDRGMIAGSVKDPSGAVLPGARVQIEKGPSAVSDAQGQFILPNLTPGTYRLSVSYVGFSPLETSATVAGGQAARVDAILKVDTTTSVVTVNGSRQLGEVEAINIERTADNIVQVVPSQVITSLPNMNVADAVGRLPSVSLERDEGEGKYVQIRGTEPRLSNVTINGVNVPSPEGNVRNIKLDVIPSSVVDRIEVFKTLSANQDGDAIGGTVNLVTKTPTEMPTLDLEGLAGHTNVIGGRWLDTFTATAGERAGSRKQWGFLMSGTYDWNGRGINDLESASTPLPPSGQNQIGATGPVYPTFASEDLRTYKYYRTRYGFSPDIDYQLKPGSSMYLKGLYSDFHDYGETYVYTPNAGNLVSANRNQYTFDNAGFMQYREYIRRPDQQIFSALAGGRHDLTSNLFTYEFSVSRAHNIGGQDFQTARFNGGPISQGGIAFGLDTTNGYEPKFPVLNGVNIFDPTQYNLSSYNVPNYASTQLNFQGAASYQRRYSAKDHYGTFEMGLKIRNGRKTHSENDYIFDNNPASVTLNDVLNTFSNPTYYDGAFKVGPLSDFNKIHQLSSTIESQLGFDAAASQASSIPSDYDANERIYAGYLMNSIGFGKLNIQTGVRFEQTSATYSALGLATDSIGNVTVTTTPGSSSYLNVMPSVQLQYRLQQDTNLRGSFFKGISRPNFADIVPSQLSDVNTSPFPTITTGNPALQATRAEDYDVIVEHFFRPYGILQAGFFYKNLHDPIYATTVIKPGGPGTPFPSSSNYFVQEPINGPGGHLAGFEAAWEQRLSFLPGLLNGLGVALNYSYTTSQVTFPPMTATQAGFNGARNDHPALQRQVPNNYNLGFTYDKKRLSMRFAMSHNDASIYSYFWSANNGPASDPVLGLKGPNGDVYLYAHTQYDIQGNYRLYKGLSFVAYGLNLGNEVFGFYQGSKHYPIQREFYHPTFSFGMRWTSAPE